MRLRQHSWPDELVAEMARGAPAEGPNASTWPGLTFYRYTEPTQPRWAEHAPLSICVVAHDAGVTGGRDGAPGDGAFTYRVIGSDTGADVLRMDASPETPCLCFLLEVDPELISTVSTSMLDCAQPHHTADECAVAVLDEVLLSSVLRFLRSLSAPSDRCVLSPLYLQELVYRILQRGQYARLVRIAAQHMSSAPIASTLDYIAAHLADPLTVAELASQANMSPSAFSRTFREATGRSPYQFVKEKRLTRARELLGGGHLSVTDVSRRVGYLSLSHFIKEFRNQYGATPGDYVDAQTFRGAARALRSTDKRPPAQLGSRPPAQLGSRHPAGIPPAGNRVPTPTSRAQVPAEAGTR